MNRQTSTVSGHDSPIESVEDDLLNGLGIARAIHRVLVTAPADWSTRIGLYGPWGSGKTSILNLLKTLEESDGALVISFSAWSASGESGVISQLYATLADRLRDAKLQLPIKQRAKSIAAKARRLVSLQRLIGIGAEEVAPVPPLVKKIATEALSKLSDAASAWGRIGRKDLEAIVDLLNGRRVVVFIDDLDRADPRLVPKTLLAMRELLDWPGFSFVLAFDKRAIAGALSEYSTAFGEDAQGFLEKVIDVPFEVAPPRDQEKKLLAEHAFNVCCDVMPGETIATVLTVLPSQPRRVKLIARMIGALRSSLVRHSTEEIDWTGIALYLIVKEASQSVADWVVKAATAEGTDWVLWVGDKEEKAKREMEAKQILLDLLSTPNSPPDAERVVDAALRLLRHWDMASDESILYWVGLAYREPSVTLSEARKLRDEFAETKDASIVDAALLQAVSTAGMPEREAATDYLTTAVAVYRQALDAMADADTSAEWSTRHAIAEKTLLLLEHLWTQKANPSLATAATQGATTAMLLGLVVNWLGWTKNEGEVALRQRERNLALAATDSCVAPELLFAETDPFWNSHWSVNPERAEIVEEWRNSLRDALAPRIVSRLCEKFIEVDGLFPVATGNDQLGPWLVECKKSPLYNKPELTQKLVATLRAGRGATELIRVALSKNAQLYLRQLLFQTRDGSWGGIDHAKAIHATCPDIIPSAWSSIIDVSVPFRMRSSLEKLRIDLLAIGVAEDQLPKPPWLVEESNANAES